MRPFSILRLSVPPKENIPIAPGRDPAAALLRLAALYEKRLRPRLAPLLPEGMTKVQHAALLALPPRKTVLARDLSRNLKIGEGYLSRILGQLEQRGLIFRQEGSDGRQWPVKLTAAGRLYRLRHGRARKEAAAALLRHLPRQQRNDLARALEKVWEILQRSGTG